MHRLTRAKHISQVLVKIPLETLARFVGNTNHSINEVAVIHDDLRQT